MAISMLRIRLREKTFPRTLSAFSFSLAPRVREIIEEPPVPRTIPKAIIIIWTGKAIERPPIA
ncbi:hypothetical protein SDC9_211156 [bioreactor metagenome]|uniref:Uncharacterized protein n=1 Tax=bioreactor metagenome TaxID=1076179 RepID=A0A645JI91_9ZZZZ